MVSIIRGILYLCLPSNLPAAAPQKTAASAAQGGAAASAEGAAFPVRCFVPPGSNQRKVSKRTLLFLKKVSTVRRIGTDDVFSTGKWLKCDVLTHPDILRIFN